MDQEYLRSTIEALVLASPEPLPARKITQVVNDITAAQVTQIIADLNALYADNGVSFRIRELAGGFQFYILPEYVGFVEELFARRRKMRLTRASLETLAIVAYRQPVTKTDIEHIRGVASDGVLHNLLEKKLVAITGRAETVGKPLQYGTTSEFLKFFGLNSLRDLPKMSEIEELIASSEPKSQTELRLVETEDGEVPVKLNIADGTFDPEEWRRGEDDTDADSRRDDLPVAVEDDDVTDSEEAAEQENTSEEEEVTSGTGQTLVLKKAAPDEGDQSASSETDEERPVVFDSETPVGVKAD